MPRLQKWSLIKNLRSSEKEKRFASSSTDVKQRLNKSEFVFSQVGTYIEESLAKFREFLTESIKEFTEKVIWYFKN